MDTGFRLLLLPQAATSEPEDSTITLLEASKDVSSQTEKLCPVPALCVFRCLLSGPCL